MEWLSYQLRLQGNATSGSGTIAPLLGLEFSWECVFIYNICVCLCIVSVLCVLPVGHLTYT